MQQAPHALYLRLLAVVAAALVCVALAGRIRDTALVDVQTIATTPSTIVKSTTPPPRPPPPPFRKAVPQRHCCLTRQPKRC